MHDGIKNKYFGVAKIKRKEQDIEMTKILEAEYDSLKERKY